MEGLKILVANNLEARGIPLFGNIDRPREENFPAPIPPLAVGSHNLGLVFAPIVEPKLDGL